MLVKTRYFFDFLKYLRNYKEFSKSQYPFFQVLLSTISYKGSSKFNETFLKFSQKTAGFFFLTSLLASFAPPKNKNSKASIVGILPPPLSFPCYLSLSVWCVYVYLHHFYQCYLYFTGRA